MAVSSYICHTARLVVLDGNVSLVSRDTTRKEDGICFCILQYEFNHLLHIMLNHGISDYKACVPMNSRNYSLSEEAAFNCFQPELTNSM